MNVEGLLKFFLSVTSFNEGLYSILYNSISLFLFFDELVQCDQEHERMKSSSPALNFFAVTRFTARHPSAKKKQQARQWGFDDKQRQMRTASMVEARPTMEVKGERHSNLFPNCKKLRWNSPKITLNHMTDTRATQEDVVDTIWERRKTLWFLESSSRKAQKAVPKWEWCSKCRDDKDERQLSGDGDSYYSIRYSASQTTYKK